MYRRLAQDVPGFEQFLTEQADALSLSNDQLGAKLIGRWKSGAPLERVHGFTYATDPAALDPSTTDPAVLENEHVNNFQYRHRDSDGHAVPRAAHIRKNYPRDEQPPGDGESERHRILRRGIPYGPEVQSGEDPYSGGPVPDNRDRGLLFLCYQADIAHGFEFIQTQWVNHDDFPQSGDGQDPIISQDNATPAMAIPPNPHVALANWVTTTGGEYFFSPSISAITALGAELSN